ncbi:hypothetical protein CYMTET_15226 [Cymbomonas tetramitiformis]|uniref:Uncharacterized protein n=1 Tax=Cymbomonas tetramitiformis TaxID=36881 RepID=A0AAE0GEG4_9CHLO|nr:hypothetical protein CYMTET_15226 [Cymbomonas tetramitiformis]
MGQRALAELVKGCVSAGPVPCVHRLSPRRHAAAGGVDPAILSASIGGRQGGILVGPTSATHALLQTAADLGPAAFWAAVEQYGAPAVITPSGDDDGVHELGGLAAQVKAIGDLLLRSLWMHPRTCISQRTRIPPACAASVGGERASCKREAVGGS